jgi:ABC-type sugar transport system permease subunit
MTRETASNLRAQLRDFAVAAVAAVVVATCAFVAARNTELAAQQLDLATRSARAVARGDGAMPTVTASLLAPAAASPSHPYLRHREILLAGGGRRALGVDEKPLYDAANRADRSGAFAEMLPDGTGRAIAAQPAGDAHAGDGHAVAVAITSPARPAPYPLLVMIGVLGLGVALAAAGGLVGGNAAPVGMGAGVLAIAVPTALWQAWIATAVIAVVALGVALAQRHRLTDRFFAGLHEHRVALSFVTPAAIAMLILVAAPFVVGIAIGFYDHHNGGWTFVGLDNFGRILSGNGKSLDDPLNFWFIVGVTVLWTVVNVIFHVVIGVALALVLSRSWLKGKGVFRMLLILPWAIPNYITALIWKGMFTGEYGAINSLLHSAGLSDVSWFGSWATAFSANVITNTWLGFPFMMVVALGALESIPRELYEAAAVDGASAWQRFRHITLPHLRPALGPAVALGSIWTFNMFNIIYLVSGGKPGDSTNILVTDAYRWAFERGERYGIAGAEATLIFLILLLWTVFGTRIVKRPPGDA